MIKKGQKLLSLLLTLSLLFQSAYPSIVLAQEATISPTVEVSNNPTPETASPQQSVVTDTPLEVTPSPDITLTPSPTFEATPIESVTPTITSTPVEEVIPTPQIEDLILDTPPSPTVTLPPIENEQKKLEVDTTTNISQPSASLFITQGSPSLAIEVLSWDTIGLDSNKPVSAGPHQFIIHARITNTGADTAVSTHVNFNLNSGTSYISLADAESAVRSLGDISAGESRDVFFQIKITPPGSPDSPQNDVFGKTRDYSLTVSSQNFANLVYDGTLNIEKLQSQNRNSILQNVVSPSSIRIGDNFTVTVTSKTTGGGNFDYVSVPMLFNQNVASLISNTTIYQTPPTTQTDFFASNVGGTITSTFTFKALNAGTTQFYWLIYDKSGGSYHYNSDFGNAIVVNVEPAYVVTKTPAEQTVYPNSEASFTLAVNNTGNGNGSVSTVVDTLPAGFTYVPGSTVSNYFSGDPSIAGQNLSWTGPWTILPNGSISISYKAKASSVSGDYTNIVIAYNGTQNVGQASALVHIKANPVIILEKIVRGGSALSSSWSFAIAGVPGTYHHGDEISLPIGTYTITESSSSDYTLSSVAGLCSGVNDRTATLTVGELGGKCTFTNTRNTATLTVVKHLSPEADSGRFNLLIDGNVAGTGTNVGNDGTTGSVIVYSGNHIVSETAADSTEIDNYQSSVECTNGQESNSLPLSVSLEKDEDVTCTITNTRKTGSLKVNSSLDTNGDGTFESGNDTANFLSQKWGIDSATPDQLMGDTLSNLNTGTHYVNVTDITNYHLVGWYPTQNSDYSCTNPQFTTLPASVDIQFSTTSEITACYARNTGYLQAVKIVDDSSDLTNWGFRLNGGNVVPADNSGRVDFGSQITSSYSLEEMFYSSGNWIQTTDYTLDSVTGVNCSRNSDSTVTALVTTGSTTICTFSNTINRGSLTIIKDSQPNDSQDFRYVVSGSGLSNFSLDDDTDPTLSNSRVFSNLFPATYSVTELSESGWTLSSLSCQSSLQRTILPFVTSTATVTLLPGENITCTFVNTRDTGTITLNKSLIPTDDSGKFNLLIGGTIYAGNVSNLGTTGSISLPTGEYTLSETAGLDTNLSNYLSSYSCNNEMSGNGTSFKLIVEKGKDVTCTFTNTKYSSITIIKNSLPDSPQDFTFTGAFEEFKLDDDNDATLSNIKIFSGLTSSPYTITESELSGWKLTDLSCVSDLNVSTIEKTGSSVTITPFAGDSLTCTFTNTRLNSITAHKFNDLNGDGRQLSEPNLSNWTMQLFAGKSCDGEPLSSIDTNNDGNAVFNDLLPGDYSVREVLPSVSPAWYNVTPLCQSQTVNAGDPSPTLNFANFRLPSINGYKFNDLNGNGSWEKSVEFGLASWEIILERSEGDGWVRVDNVRTDTNGYWSFIIPSPGTYRVSENNQTGWTPTTANRGIYGPFTPTSGESISDINFGNRGDLTISGYKYSDLNGNSSLDEDEAGIPGWRISLYPCRYYRGEGVECDSLALSTQDTDELGKYTFSNLEPGYYRVVEEDRSEYQKIKPLSGYYDVDLTDSISITHLDFYNQFISPVLTLTKTNNKQGVEQFPGALVTYTLTLKIAGNSLTGLKVKDLPPGGFKYLKGSYKIKLNGTLQTGLPEPAYASPGLWDLSELGELAPGDEITLEYIAEISSDQQPGLYKDIAWAVGRNSNEDSILANIDSGYFVGTDVGVGKDVKSTLSYDVEREEKITGQVLGASTSLPSTGASPLWLILPSLLLINGVSFSALGLLFKRKNYV